MFFELHDEGKIGYKKLSMADLGTAPRSHQTHIGLAEAVLTFLPNRDIISEDSIFIYENRFEYIDAYFNRIENPDGTFRSPKIKTGDRACVSIVSTIRTIVKNADNNINWYLVWFGLKSKKTVFFLFNSLSDDYQKFSEFGLQLNKRGTRVVDSSNASFYGLVSYIEEKINDNGEEVLRELEIMTQIENIVPDKKYNAYDIKKANEIKEKTGRSGEEAVNQYLKGLKESGELLSYIWYNEEDESGFPYDFSIQDSKNNIKYIEVKTTGYTFEQKMVFSSQEIDFIAATPNAYWIYRLYKNGDGRYLLRVCEDCKGISREISGKTKAYSEKLEEMQIGFRGSKLAVSPTLAAFSFKSEIAI